MNRRHFTLFSLLFVFMAGACLHAADLTVFAAASLTDSLKEAGAAWEKQSGDKVTFDFDASSTLARQIEAGAPADIFFSADEAKMDSLEQGGHILKGTRRSLLGNSLVVVIPADSSMVINSLADLAGDKVKRLALADPKAVPAGVYSRQTLEKLKLWDQVRPKVVPTQNVRAALAAVESGDVEAGMVFKTDAAISKKVKVAFVVPSTDAPDISYPMAVVNDTKQPEAARKFLAYLGSDDASAMFEKYGFVVRK
jgi:molybdate transport system substrate-binding protein